METLLFSPPEVSKKAKDLGKSADIWALGVTFYYFMTGEYPWKGAQNPSPSDGEDEEENAGGNAPAVSAHKGQNGAVVLDKSHFLGLAKGKEYTAC